MKKPAVATVAPSVLKYEEDDLVFQKYKECWEGGQRGNKEDTLRMVGPYFKNREPPSGHAVEMWFERRAVEGKSPPWFVEWFHNVLPLVKGKGKAKKKKKEAEDDNAELARLYAADAAEARAGMAEASSMYLAAVRKIEETEALAEMAVKSLSEEIASLHRELDEAKALTPSTPEVEVREIIKEVPVIGISEDVLLRVLMDVMNAHKFATAERYLRPIAKNPEEFKAFLVQMALRPLAQAKVLTAEDLGPFRSWFTEPS